MGSREANTGFTLIEMMVVIAISAILLAVGVPSFTYMMDRTRVANEVNEVLADLALTRAEAITRRGRVIICRSSTPTSASATCDVASTDWTPGWIVFVDDTTTGTAFQRDPAEPIIRGYVTSTQQVTITAAPALAGLTVTADGTVFVLDGNPLNSLGTATEPLRIDFSGTDPSNRRSVCVATTGRARTSSTFGVCL
jgi:type IV fimbrial biogenesis protein FimT